LSLETRRGIGLLFQREQNPSSDFDFHPSPDLTGDNNPSTLSWKKSLKCRQIGCEPLQYADQLRYANQNDQTRLRGDTAPRTLFKCEYSHRACPARHPTTVNQPHTARTGLPSQPHTTLIRLADAGCGERPSRSRTHRSRRRGSQ